VLIHGFPLNGASWEKQVAVLLEAGHRVITYDRRGFGKSSQPSVGYDYDTFASDLHSLMTTLDLREAALAGFSMGTGEVTRYLGSYGSERVSKVALLAPIPPFLLQTDDNPTGVPQGVFDGIKRAIQHDRMAFLSTFFDNFYNTDVFLGSRVSQERIRADFIVASQASAIATLHCVDTWLTDFRADLSRFDIPTLIVQGDADRILPFPSTGQILAPRIPESNLVTIPGAPHALAWTHAEEVNEALLSFLGR
jgi:non-heme chloroperoxidase